MIRAFVSFRQVAALLELEAAPDESVRAIFSFQRVVAQVEPLEHALPVDATQKVKTEVVWRSIQLDDFYVDADSKNRVLDPDTVSAGDLPSLTPILRKSDAVGALDSLVGFALTLGKADAVLAADTFARVVAFIRAFADAINATDAKIVSFTKASSDAVSATDTPTPTLVYGSEIAGAEINAVEINL